MESSNRNCDFQNSLKQIAFKTYFHNQVTTFGYDDLFAGRRVLVFSITHVMQSSVHFRNVNSHYQGLIDAGLDDVYCINSDNVLVGPWADKLSTTIKGLPDINKEFITALSVYTGSTLPISMLSNFWQYMVIIDNGLIEYIWQTPLKSNITWKLIKTKEYRYYGLDPVKIKKYLVDTTSNI